ncbi:hypothetical protein ACIBH1_12260 [Nonomuraea sp. NPDC050663]
MDSDQVLDVETGVMTDGGIRPLLTSHESFVAMFTAASPLWQGASG